MSTDATSETESLYVLHFEADSETVYVHGLPGGHYALIATSGGRTLEDRGLFDGNYLRVELDFVKDGVQPELEARPGRIDLQLSPPPGTSASDLRAYVLVVAHGSVWSYADGMEGRTDFALHGVPHGTYDVLVWANGYWTTISVQVGNEAVRAVVSSAVWRSVETAEVIPGDDEPGEGTVVRVLAPHGESRALVPVWRFPAASEGVALPLTLGRYLSSAMVEAAAARRGPGGEQVAYSALTSGRHRLTVR